MVDQKHPPSRVPRTLREAGWANLPEAHRSVGKKATAWILAMLTAFLAGVWVGTFL